jgi:hypothetical protein
MESALVTTAMLTPIVDTITANVGVILPIGLTIMGIMVGLSLIPRVLYKFM